MNEEYVPHVHDPNEQPFMVWTLSMDAFDRQTIRAWHRSRRNNANQRIVKHGRQCSVRK